MTHKHWHLIIPIISPFTGEDKLDIDAYNKLVSTLLSKGISELLVGSLYGESHLMNNKEYENILRHSIDYAKRLDLIAFSPRTTNLENILLDLRIGIDLGYKIAFIPISLEFTKSDIHVYRYYDFISSKVDIDVVIFIHDPRLTINHNVLAELANENPQIIGVVVSSHDINYLINLMWRLKHEVRSNFLLLSGLDEVFPLSLILGFNGGLVLSAQVIPNHYIKLLKYFKEQELDKFIKTINEILLFTRLYEEAYSRISIIKIALSIMYKWFKPILKQPQPSEHSYLYSEVKHILCSLGYINGTGN